MTSHCNYSKTQMPPGHCTSGSCLSLKRHHSITHCVSVPWTSLLFFMWQMPSHLRAFVFAVCSLCLGQAPHHPAQIIPQISAERSPVDHLLWTRLSLLVSISAPLGGFLSMPHFSLIASCVHFLFVVVLCGTDHHLMFLVPY